jgi:hypothetical protein
LGGNGGAGTGGGLDVAGGTVSLSDDTVSNNAARGGTGGAGGSSELGGPGGAGGTGGKASGGGMYVVAGVTVVGDSVTNIVDNTVTAAAGGVGGNVNGNRGAAGTASFSDIAANSAGLGYYFYLSGQSVTLLASSPGQSVYGQSVTFAADVVGLQGTPGGTVTFYDDGISIGQRSLDGSGVATLSTSALPVGSDSITVTYSGGGAFSGSSSTALTLTVAPAATAITLSSSQISADFGLPVTFTATVAADSPSAATVVGGTVQFLIDGVNFGNPVSVNSSGVAASLPAGAAQLTAGYHDITAVYSGGTNFLTSSAVSYSASVLADSPTAYYPLHDSSGTSARDDSGNGLNGTYQGGVTFGLPGPARTTTAVQLDGSTGSISLPSGAFGTYPTRANTPYTLTFEIWFKAAPGSTGGVILGQSGSGGGYVPAVMLGAEGRVYSSLFWLGSQSDVITSSSSYNDGNWHLLDTSYSNGTQSLYIDGVLIGTQNGQEIPYDSSYSYALGTGNSAGWSGGNGGEFYFNGELAEAAVYPTALSANQIETHTQQVDASLVQIVTSPTSAVVSSSARPSSFGQSVTLTATVSATAPGAGIPAGIVTFLDNGAILGTASLSGGTAALTTSALPVGNDAITVSYSGASLFDAGTSPAFTQVVNQANTLPTVESSSNPSAFGQTITFTVTVAPQFSGTPTGTVTLREGNAILDTASLVGGVATFTTSSLPIGNDAVTASYGGDGNFNASVSASYSQIVLPGTTTVVGSSANPLTFGQSATFTATVTANLPSTLTVNTGTVQFLIDGIDFGSPVSVNSSGIAVSIATGTTQLAPGPHTVSAIYDGGS